MLEAEGLQNHPGAIPGGIGELHLQDAAQVMDAGAGGVDHNVGFLLNPVQHLALAVDPALQRIAVLQRVGAAHLVKAGNQGLVGRLQEEHDGLAPGVDQLLEHPCQAAGKRTRPHVGDDRQLLHRGFRVKAELHHPHDQLRREVIRDVPAHLLEHGRGGAAASTGHAGDED